MSERLALMAGNWKMNLNAKEAAELARAIGRETPSSGVEVMVAPPFTALPAVAEASRGLPIKLGAQNCYPAREGAFTGEISPPMLKDLGVTYVILGHSERRHVLGESNGFIRDKVAAVQESGLIPVLCCGELLEEREAGRTMEVIETQLAQGLKDISLSGPGGLVMAYEPVWAIGTGKTATPELAQEVHGRIREWLGGRYNKELAKGVRILYGGSVKGSNVKALMAEADIDGALVGGASLSAEAFLPIVNYRL